MATAAQQARWRARVAEAGRCSNCGRSKRVWLREFEHGSVTVDEFAEDAQITQTGR